MSLGTAVTVNPRPCYYNVAHTGITELEHCQDKSDTVVQSARDILGPTPPIVIVDNSKKKAHVVPTPSRISLHGLGV